MFCRHNRLEATCPICSRKAKREQVEAPRRATPRPARHASGRRPSATRAGDLRVRRMARAADDGYEHELLPGLRSSVDADRLAEEIAFAANRLEELSGDPPGLYADIAQASDVEEAAWLAFVIAYLSPLSGDDPWAGIAAARTTWSSGELPPLDEVPLGPRTAHVPARGAATVVAYRAFAQRAGSQAAAFTGDAAWTEQRRFDRAFERLALPGFGRAARYELLILLGRLGVFPLRPWSLQLGADALDPTVVASKRALGIGDPLLLQRRAADLATAAGVPIEALDLALTNWSRAPDDRITAGATVTAAGPRRDAIAAALGV
ncbi:MAG: hypothetical protein V7607_1881 [Solirubrobacteraceae bacterium]